MPTNLPPEYFEADKRYREAQSLPERISSLEQLISTVPKHKGTDKLRADLRRQLSRLREEAQSHKKHAGHQPAYHIEKEGAGQVVLIGPTNVGKSSLVAALTHARPEISAEQYTTWRPIPGMMPVVDIQVQLVDTPSLDPEFSEAILFDLIRKADLLLLVVDIQSDPLQQLEVSLALLLEHKIAPLAWRDRYEDQPRMTFIPLIVLANKWDDDGYDEDIEVLCELFEGECPLLPVSAVGERNFDRLKLWIYERLDVIRVYAKPPGKEPDMDRPWVLKKGSTVKELARMVHKDFYEHLKSARVWGSTTFEGQMVSRDYELKDGDIIELKEK
jgi:hypothetical protein